MSFLFLHINPIFHQVSKSKKRRVRVAALLIRVVLERARHVQRGVDDLRYGFDLRAQLLLDAV